MNGRPTSYGTRIKSCPPREANSPITQATETSPLSDPMREQQTHQLGEKLEDFEVKTALQFRYKYNCTSTRKHTAQEALIVWANPYPDFCIDRSCPKMLN